MGFGPVSHIISPQTGGWEVFTKVQHAQNST